MLTVVSRVFGKYTLKFISSIKKTCEDIVLGWQPITTSQVWVFFCLHQWGWNRTGQTRLHCVFGVLFPYTRTLTRITTGLYLQASTCSTMSTDRSRCSPDTVKPLKSCPSWLGGLLLPSVTPIAEGQEIWCGFHGSSGTTGCNKSVHYILFIINRENES